MENYDKFNVYWSKVEISDNPLLSSSVYLENVIEYAEKWQVGIGKPNLQMHVSTVSGSGRYRVAL